MANVTAGLGIQIYDNSYTGGASDKIARIISGKLQVETGIINVNATSGSIQTIQGLASGFPLTIQGLTSGSPVATNQIEIISNTINAYGTSANVTTSNSSVVSYLNISVGQTFVLKEIIASASSGPVKVIVEYAAASTGPSSGTYAVGFFTSANPTLALPFYQPIVATGPTYVRVTMRNDSAFTQDLYATIIGRLV